MSKNGGGGSGGGFNMRSGALVLKSISIFLASGRRSANKSTAGTQQSSKKQKKSKKMDKDNKNKLSPKLLEVLKKETHFSRTEIGALYRIYRNLVALAAKHKSTLDKNFSLNNNSFARVAKSSQGIPRNIFCQLLHNTFDIITEDLLMDKMFSLFDKDNQGMLSAKLWFEGLNVFLKGSFAEQRDFCFSVYDLNDDGYITREEMFALLRNCLIKHPQDEDPDEGVKELVEIVLKKMDKDGDGRISRDDFCASVTEQPLLLQALGPCLPSKRAKDTFLATLNS